MPADEPVTWSAGALAAADLNAVRNLLRYLGGFDAGSKPFARVRSSVPVSLPTSPDWNDLTFDTEVINRGESLLFDSGSPEIFTIPADGFYLCGACCRTAPTTANKALRLVLNGTTAIVEQDNIGISTPAYTEMNVTTLYQFATGDTIGAQVYQDAGEAIDAVVDGLASPVMWCAWYAIDDA